MYDIILSVVEAKAVPSRMLMPVAGIEILVRISSKISQTLYLILHGMRVDNIHDDCDAVAVCLVYESLQFLRSTEA